MRLAFERGAHVRRRRLAAIDVEHGRLDEDQPAFGGFVGQEHRVTWRITSMPLRSRGDGSSRSSDWPAFDDRQRARACRCRRVDDAAVMPRGDADDLPREVEAIGDFAEQRHEPPRDVAEADQDQRELGLGHVRQVACARCSASDVEQIVQPVEACAEVVGGSPKPSRR